MSSIATRARIPADNAAVSHASRPNEQWQYLAARIAGQPRMCVSRNGGRTYPSKYDRGITWDSPSQPAAVFVYGPDGCASTLVLDLDARSKDTTAGTDSAVEADLRRLTLSLRKAQVGHVVDGSPNGGRHVYIPLAERLGRSILGEITKNLAAEFPTLDPTPMLNVSRGLIRPPGARHRSGGHQALLGATVHEAVRVFREKNSIASFIAWAEQFEPEMVFRLEQVLERAPATQPPSLPTRLSPTREHQPARVETPAALEAAGWLNDITGRWRDVAVTGQYEQHGYATGSEARQGVLWAAAHVGMTLPQVVARIEDGTWRGLRSLYAKYSPHVRRGEIALEWRKAVELEQRRRAGSKRVQQSTTSPPNTRRGGDRTFLRAWANVVDVRYRDANLATRAVLLALLGCAMRKGSVALDFGNRHLSLHSTLDHSTVGTVLKALAAEDNPVIERSRDAFGPLAHEYTLVMPTGYEHVERQPLRRGRLDGVLPVFRELGLGAAFVYEALQQTTIPSSVREMAATAHLSVGATHEALLILSEHGLATKTADGWVLGAADPARLAEALGVDAVIRALIGRFRAERDLWWARIGYVPLRVSEPPSEWTGDVGPPGEPGTIYVPPPPDPLEASTVDPWTAREQALFRDAYSLVETMLGGVVV